VEEPLLLGLIVGGLPFAAAFDLLGGRVVSAELLRFVLLLTPIAIMLATAGALLGAEQGGKGLVVGDLLTSMGASVPLPLLVCLVLARGHGYDVSPSAFAALLDFFVLWAFAVGVSRCPFTFIVTVLKSQILRQGRTHV
jgi:hypothetical protein